MLRSLIRNSIRLTSISQTYQRNMAVASKTVKFCQYGQPADVLQIIDDQVGEPTCKQVLVKMLAAPINPSDINTIQGTYAVKPKLPAVPGNEGVGEVVAIGEEVEGLECGQKVIPYVTGLGTWRTHLLANEDQLMAVPCEIGVAEAATLMVNPPTAYRLLKDFVSLCPGESVIQNAANSAVGQAVHQLCKAWDLESIGIVRDRPDIIELKNKLRCLGATEVLTEAELRTQKLFTDGGLKKPRLALNGIGGKNATELMRHLDYQGTMVTYGGMSREPVIAPTGALIFQDIRLRGFWVTKWSAEYADDPKRAEMFDELFKLIEEGKLKAPEHEMIPLKRVKDVVGKILDIKGFLGKKQILTME